MAGLQHKPVAGSSIFFETESPVLLESVHYPVFALEGSDQFEWQQAS
jgi:hypothetical protein